MLSSVDIVVLTSNYIQRITGLIRSDFYRWRKSIKLLLKWYQMTIYIIIILLSIDVDTSKFFGIG